MTAEAQTRRCSSKSLLARSISTFLRAAIFLLTRKYAEQRASIYSLRRVSKARFRSLQVKQTIPHPSGFPPDLRQFGRGRGSKTAWNPGESNVQAWARMFQREIFGKSQSIHPCFVRLDVGRRCFVGVAQPPGRMTTHVLTGRLIFYVAFPEDVHRSSSRSVSCLNDARRERSLESSRRENLCCYYTQCTPKMARVPPAPRQASSSRR